MGERRHGDYYLYFVVVLIVVFAALVDMSKEAFGLVSMTAGAILRDIGSKEK